MPTDDTSALSEFPSPGFHTLGSSICGAPCSLFAPRGASGADAGGAGAAPTPNAADAAADDEAAGGGVGRAAAGAGAGSTGRPAGAGAGNVDVRAAPSDPGSVRTVADPSGPGTVAVAAGVSRDPSSVCSPALLFGACLLCSSSRFILSMFASARRTLAISASVWTGADGGPRGLGGLDEVCGTGGGDVDEDAGVGATEAGVGAIGTVEGVGGLRA